MRRHVMKLHQIDVTAAAVIGHFEEVDYAEESRGAGQRGSDVKKTDRFYGIHFDLTFLHFVTAAHFHMRAGPHADAARDVSPANAIPEALGEHHSQSLRL